MNAEGQVLRSIEETFDHIATAGELANVPYDAEEAHRALFAFRDFFFGSPISFRATTKPLERRALAVRYMEYDIPHDPYRIALEYGLIDVGDHPIGQAIPTLQKQIGFMGWGVDVGMDYGMEKIWPFFAVDMPRDEAYALPFLPSYLNRHEEHFRRFGLRDVNLIGFDFRRRSFNLYFALGQDQTFTPGLLVDLLDDLGFEIPPTEELEYITQTRAVYYTFTWDSDEVQRFCFTTVIPKDYVPTHMHPVIERFVSGVPFISDPPMFIMCPTYARDGNYIKIENDYTGEFRNLFRRMVVK